jgi:hypothetical protein
MKAGCDAKAKGQLGVSPVSIAWIVKVEKEKRKTDGYEEQPTRPLPIAGKTNREVDIGCLDALVFLGMA